MDTRMLGWALLVSGLLVGGYAALVGFASWEVTLLFIVFGLTDALVGVLLLVRGRQAG